MQMDNQIPEKSKMNDIYSFLTFKKVEIIEKSDERVNTISILNDNSIRATFFRRKVLLLRLRPHQLSPHRNRERII